MLHSYLGKFDESDKELFALNQIKEHILSTQNEGVLSSVGNYAGLYDSGEGKTIVSSVNSVGTKLRIALILNRHDTIGIDAVAVCVNDIICHGAKPLFFLDYIATGKVYAEKIEIVMKGISRGCSQAGCSLIGGQTSEMPGFYKSDEYDMCGFCVGSIDRDKIIDGRNVKSGDVLIGLASNGLHASGFSLIRKLFSLDALTLSHYVDSLGSNFGEELLKPSKIYASSILAINQRFEINSIAHIADGGFEHNIPRLLPQNLRAKIKLGSWPILPIFELIRAANNSPMEELFSVFNMGIGMVMCVPPNYADAVLRCAKEMGEKAYIIGEVVEGEHGMDLCQ